MQWRALPLLLVLLLPLSATAKVQIAPEAIPLAGPMVADVSQTTVEIHSGFTGMQLLVFGARNVGGDLVIAVRGPQANFALRRKERIAGMWMHVDKHKYFGLPTFYALASTRPLSEIAPTSTLASLGLGEHAILARGNSHQRDDFNAALSSQYTRKGLWQEPFGEITYFGESLFKARLMLPDRLPRGAYSVEVYLFEGGKPIAFQSIPLNAYKTGMDARIYDIAQHYPWLYGIVAVLIALFGGWLAHRLFHRH
jgi:uncharacterized protein (TIGR02186 family)